MTTPQVIVLPEPSFHVDTLWREIAGDNDEAFRFMQAWNAYCHAVDDIVDGDTPGTEDLLKVLLAAHLIYTSNFFTKNVDMLSPLVGVITNAYLDSVEWETSPDVWKRTIADQLRSYGNEMILQVAEIVGGWPHRRKFSQRIRALSYMTHHTKEGVAI